MSDQPKCEACKHPNFAIYYDPPDNVAKCCKCSRVVSVVWYKELGETIVPHIDPAILKHIPDIQDR